jgi:hypothetical protein
MSRRALALVLVTLGGCASYHPLDRGRFPLRPPMWRDTDLDSVSVPCRPDPKKPGKQLCRPDSYESSFAWDGFDNLMTRPLASLWKVELASEAININSLDEVPDSSWFANRIGRQPMTPDQVGLGSCPEDELDTDMPDGSWVVDQGKENGANPGFRVKLPDGRRFMMKADTADGDERATAAAVIASKLYHAAGWHTTCERIVYARRSLFKLTPGLTVTDNTRRTRPFDQAAFDKLLDNARQKDGLVRLDASLWLDGRALGPFRYDGLRKDDPNDVIPHQHRRDLRGGRLLAAWLNHFDSREQNSMEVWVADDPKESDSSPGFLKHYYIDLGDCFGSQWALDGISRRLGHAYYFDLGYVVADFFTFGLITRPWDRAEIDPTVPLFGYYHERDFRPEKWRGGYSNPAFDEMTEGDGAWAARIIARFTNEHIQAAVDRGKLTNPFAAPALTRILAARRDAIVKRYLTRLSPVTDVSVRGDRLCAVDLARRSGIFEQEQFRYSAVVLGGERLDRRAPAPAIDVGADGAICMTVPRTRPDVAARVDDPSRYTVVYLLNGHAPGRLVIHLYDLGPTAGFYLAGLERPY